MNGFPFDIVGFDLDGTLVDTNPDLAPAINVALEAAGRPTISADSTRKLIGGGSRKMLQRGLDLTGGPVPDRQFEELYARLLTFYEANIAVHSRPYPGALDALDELSGKGVRLAVVTNKPEYLAAKLLDALDMRARFASLLGGDTLGPGRGKPAPDMIIETIARCGGGSFAMVGDSSFDVRAAKAAGKPCVALSFGYNDLPVAELGADVVIDRYDELVPALAALG
ncbi:MAG TPA: HAD-IA family hydrolase [Sphingomonadaceae bacterium]